MPAAARSRAVALLLAVLTMSLGGCAAAPALRCPQCRVLDVAHPVVPPLRAGATRLFVLVPGLLGYGWEWDGPVKRLAAHPDSDYVVFMWDPWGSVDKAAGELAGVIRRAQTTGPGSLREIVVVAHSGGGVLAAHALGKLTSPLPMKLTLVTIGAPFAGMHICPWSEEDVVHAPFFLMIAARLRHYPEPPEGTEIIEYVTSYPSDPVMHPYWGRSAAPPDVGPRGARRIAVDPALDHNKVVDLVVEGLLRR
jgi:pimeloyl-ACP methyl ester carboxylesterase